MPLTDRDLFQQLDRLDGQSYKAYRDIERQWYEFEHFDWRLDRAQADPFASPSACRVWIPPEVAALPDHAVATPIRQVALRDYLNRQFAIATGAGAGDPFNPGELADPETTAAAEVAASASSDRPTTPGRGSYDWRQHVGPGRGGRGHRGGHQGDDRDGNRGRSAEHSGDRSGRGSGKSGLIAIARPSQIVLPRSAVVLTQEEDGAWGIEVRFVVGLPAFGRRIAGRQARDLLGDRLPQVVAQALFGEHRNEAALQHHLDTVEDSAWLRSQLGDRGLITFVPDGARLPRRSGADDRPAWGEVVPFVAPPSLRVHFDCPHAGPITGLGIPPGITLLVGGGYHGKSTLLQAIERGIYDHCPDDGRERVVTVPTAVKVRAEDGRAVTGTDISTFINHLPQGNDTTQFVTPNASGSTSQAAAIAEAIEAGATLILADEDSCATNLMGRDQRMQALVPKAKEPISTLLDRIRPWYEHQDISWILAMGANGDYFDVADTVIALDAYHPQDVTAAAQAIAQAYPSGRTVEDNPAIAPPRDRYPDPHSLDPSRGQRPVKWTVRDTRQLVFGTDEIDLTAIAHVVEPEQVRAIAQALLQVKSILSQQRLTVAEVLDHLDQILDTQGLDGLAHDHPRGDLALFRRFELAATLNRLRSLRLHSGSSQN